VRLFSGLLEATATSVIDSFGDAKIHYRREVQETGYSRVETKLVTKKGDELAVDYNLQLVDGEWKVYDVAVENISMVNNYRFQFGRIIADASFKDLVRRIKKKQSRILAMKSAGIAPSALRPINIRDDSRPLILATLIGSSRDRQLIPRP
jgi:phospholipid transport system substrate-binding protein